MRSWAQILFGLIDSHFSNVLTAELGTNCVCTSRKNGFVPRVLRCIGWSILPVHCLQWPPQYPPQYYCCLLSSSLYISSATSHCPVHMPLVSGLERRAGWGRLPRFPPHLGKWPSSQEASKYKPTETRLKLAQTPWIGWLSYTLAASGQGYKWLRSWVSCMRLIP